MREKNIAYTFKKEIVRTITRMKFEDIILCEISRTKRTNVVHLFTPI